MSTFWKDKRVLVTGGAGFLGSFVVEKLKKRGCKEIFIPRSKDYNLTKMEDVKKLYKWSFPDIVIHLAAQCGGIGANQKNPGKFFYDNLMMGIQMMHVGMVKKIEKFIAIGTVCAYPKFTPTPFREDDIWNGYPEETNAPYGLAKKMLLVQSQAYRQQYGFNSIYLIPTNLYGPRDNFDPDSSHVIPALIRKMILANNRKHQEVTIWGTGEASREFLYVEDAAEAILLATEHYNRKDPINIGNGIEINIRDLVHLIAKLMGFKGTIIWDATKPNGQPRRVLDISKAKEKLDFEAKTPLIWGLKKTIEWYKDINL